MPHANVVVIGGGAAGLFCASVAASTGKSVVLLEHNNRVGAKIRISGGGRCNFTNRDVQHVNMLSRNPDFARSALSRYTPQHFVDMVERYGIQWHEKKLGQLFCDGSAQQIIDMLVDECAASHVSIVVNAQVTEVAKADTFVVRTSSNEYTADAVVVAAGGLSIPTLGASDVGYRIARSFGLRIVEPYPGLVPLTFGSEFGAQWKSLAGISVDAVVSSAKIRFRENILFTHRGLSGPAILQISSYHTKGQSIHVDVLPDVEVANIISNHRNERRLLATVLGTVLPQRFVELWPSDYLHQPVNSLSADTLEKVVAGLHSWTIYPTGTEGYAKAEVTCGGVDTTELSSKTMEAQSVPGLYFIGEVLDVTGWLGGYNFQWAWASAYAAGTDISRR